MVTSRQELARVHLFLTWKSLINVDMLETEHTEVTKEFFQTQSKTFCASAAPSTEVPSVFSAC